MECLPLDRTRSITEQWIVAIENYIAFCRSLAYHFSWMSLNVVSVSEWLCTCAAASVTTPWRKKQKYSNAGKDLQQSLFRSASTLSAKIDPTYSLCQRNTSVPCDLSSFSTYSDVCLGGLQHQQSAPCNCPSTTTCKCEKTPVVMELMLSEVCALWSPAPPPKAACSAEGDHIKSCTRYC